MKLRLIAIGTRMPTWIKEAYDYYQKRLPSAYRFELISVSPIKRSKNLPIHSLKTEEEKKLLSLIPKHSKIIALDERGKLWDTQQLAETLHQWQLHSEDISLIVGGPDGLGPICLTKATYRWSLSRLTLPHLLVRIIVVEQLYRAWSLLNNHPYHRE